MNKKELSETFALAYQNHQKNNLDIAQNLYGKILKEYPNHFETLFLLGTLSSILKNYDKVDELKKKLFEKYYIKPENFDDFDGKVNTWSNSKKVSSEHPGDHVLEKDGRDFFVSFFLNQKHLNEVNF